MKPEVTLITLAVSAGVQKVVDCSNKAKMTKSDCEKQLPPQRSEFVQIMLGLIANFSSLAPSMSLGFSAIALPTLLAHDNPHRLDESQSSWVASIASIATPIGCFISGPISDRYGRKTALLCVNVFCFIGWVVISAAYYFPENQYLLLLIGRVLTGISTGLSSMPAAVYMAEVSSPNLRGMFTTWNATSFSIGVFVIYALGWILKDDWGTTAGITAVLPCISTVLVWIYMTESPSWLISRNREEEAKTSMCKIFGTNDYNFAVQEEIDNLIFNREKSKIVYETKDPAKIQSTSKLTYFLQPTCLKPFGLILAYFFFQQFSGVFVIVFYAVDIVKEVKATMDPYFAICLIAAMRVIAAIIVGILSKRYGRRPLSFVSGAGMTLCMITLAAYLVFISEDKISTETVMSLGWLPITLLMVYFFTSTLGFLTMPFAMAAEVFPGNIRGMATGLITCIAYIFNFAIVKIYPTMMREMGNYKVFFFYGAMSLVGTVFIAIFLPETKGKTLEEIQEYFGKKDNRREKEQYEETISIKAGSS